VFKKTAKRNENKGNQKRKKNILKIIKKIIILKIIKKYNFENYKKI